MRAWEFFPGLAARRCLYVLSRLQLPIDALASTADSCLRVIMDGLEEEKRVLKAVKAVLGAEPSEYYEECISKASNDADTKEERSGGVLGCALGMLILLDSIAVKAEEVEEKEEVVEP